MALITCPDCGKEFSDSAKKCLNCGYKYKKPKNIKYSLIGGCILTVGGFLFTVWVTSEIINRYVIYYDPFTSIILLISGLAAFIVGCFLLSKQYGKKINKISYIVGGVILLINLIIAPINYHAAAEERAEAELLYEAERAQSEQAAAEQAAEEKERIEVEEKERIKKEEEERLRKGEIVIGSNGEFYLNELKEEAYKKGYEDGYNGYSGWDAVNSFERWLTFKLGTPQSDEQKENLKKCKSVLNDEYSRGRKDGWPY